MNYSVFPKQYSIVYLFWNVFKSFPFMVYVYTLQQRVDVKAFNSDGSYYNLSAVLQMSSDRTKVYMLIPTYLFGIYE